MPIISLPTAVSIVSPLTLAPTTGVAMEMAIAIAVATGKELRVTTASPIIMEPTATAHVHKNVNFYWMNFLNRRKMGIKLQSFQKLLKCVE